MMQGALNTGDSMRWSQDWLLGMPMVVLTVLIHVAVLGVIHQRTGRMFSRVAAARHPTAVFTAIMGTVTLMATALHGIECGIWASAYLMIGALSDFRSAMLFSLGAMTSYGQSSVKLDGHWLLMGAIESLNGWLLFGVTTAFLFSVVQRVWRIGSEEMQQSVEGSQR
jgi:hypothetical protein